MTKTITIVGVGALGSHVAQMLRNEGTLRLIDFDRIEQKNVLAQFHGKPSVGQLKAAALRSQLQFLWGIKATALTTKVTRDNVEVLLPTTPTKTNENLVIDCLDNFEARLLVQEHVRKYKIPCLHGALAAGGGFGRAIWDERFTIDSETGQGAATCEGGEHLPFIMITAACIAMAAQRFIREGKREGFSVTPRGGVLPT